MMSIKCRDAMSTGEGGPDAEMEKHLKEVVLIMSKGIKTVTCSYLSVQIKKYLEYCRDILKRFKESFNNDEVVAYYMIHGFLGGKEVVWGIEERKVESARSKLENIKDTRLYCVRSTSVDEAIELKKKPEPESNYVQVTMDKFVEKSDKGGTLKTKNNGISCSESVKKKQKLITRYACPVRKFETNRYLMGLDKNHKMGKSLDVDVDDVDLELEESLNEKDLCDETRKPVDDNKIGIINDEEIDLESLPEEDFNDESRKVLDNKSDDFGEDLELESLDEDEFFPDEAEGTSTVIKPL